MKKSLSVFISVLMMLSLVLTAGAAWADPAIINGSSLTWDLTDGVLTISGTGAMPDGERPWGSPAGNYGIKSIVIKEGVTRIGNNAFRRNWSLGSVTIPNTVTSIGDYAFENCSAMKEITIPDSVTSIGSNAFSQCFSLGKVTIGCFQRLPLAE